jgi:hypothetical protein
VDELPSQIMNGSDQKFLQKYNGQNYHYRRKIYAAEGKGQPPSYRQENGIGDTVKKTDNRVVRIRVNPGYNRSGDNDPHVEIEHKADDTRKCRQEIAQNEHSHFLSIFPLARIFYGRIHAMA